MSQLIYPHYPALLPHYPTSTEGTQFMVDEKSEEASLSPAHLEHSERVLDPLQHPTDGVIHPASTGAPDPSQGNDPNRMYHLPGPQVEPEAGWWTDLPTGQQLHVIATDDVRALTEDPSSELYVQLRRFFTGIFAAIPALAGSLFLSSSPVFASEGQACDSVFFTPALCISYTGGYPTGFVRAGPGSRQWYGLKLQTCVGGTGGNSCFNDVAGSFVYGYNKPYGPYMKAGKANYYRACVMYVPGGRWQCAGYKGITYLGD